MLTKDRASLSANTVLSSSRRVYLGPHSPEHTPDLNQQYRQLDSTKMRPEV